MELVGEDDPDSLPEEAPLRPPREHRHGHPAAAPSAALRLRLPRRAALAAVGGACLVGVAAACSLAARAGLISRTGGGGEMLSRGGLRGLVAEFHDPLSSSAAGMPGMPMGMDGEPASSTGSSQPAPGDTGGFGAASAPAAPGTSSGSCDSNEELYLGTCYKKCSIMTNGTYAKRIAPTGCCRELSAKCILSSEVDFNGIFPGQGYNVDGQNGKPHPPGICDGNEELFAGMCYKKCSILTNSEYKERSGPNTCCKASPCWNPFEVESVGGTCSGYAVGGGVIGDHNCPHAATPVSAVS